MADHLAEDSTPEAPVLAIGSIVTDEHGRTGLVVDVAGEYPVVSWLSSPTECVVPLSIAKA